MQRNRPNWLWNENYGVMFFCVWIWRSCCFVLRECLSQYSEWNGVRCSQLLRPPLAKLLRLRHPAHVFHGVSPSSDCLMTRNWAYGILSTDLQAPAPWVELSPLRRPSDPSGRRRPSGPGTEPDEPLKSKNDGGLSPVVKMFLCLHTCNIQDIEQQEILQMLKLCCYLLMNFVLYIYIYCSLVLSGDLSFSLLYPSFSL